MRRTKIYARPLVWYEFNSTTTGSATAITHIFPELKGKLTANAVTHTVEQNASLTDWRVRMNRREPTEVEIKQILKRQ